jgi:hypothetical protein
MFNEETILDPESYFGTEPVDGGNGVKITLCRIIKREVVIPPEIRGIPVTSIGGGAFSDNPILPSFLTSVTIPDSVTSIGELAFRGCTNLTGITIPNSVTSIGDWAFYRVSEVMLHVPNSVTSIGDWAFYKCESLTGVTIGNGVTTIGGGAFAGCKSLTAINVAANNSAYTSENGILYNKNKTVLHTYPAGKADNSFTIPSSVTSIGYLAFSLCTSLTSVTIPDNVTSIGIGAFAGCTSLTSITIPDSVTSIGDTAFWGCTSLTSVTIGSGVTSIGIGAFAECTSLTSITIPNSVTSIGLGSFSAGLENAYNAAGRAAGMYTHNTDSYEWTKN